MHGPGSSLNFKKLAVAPDLTQTLLTYDLKTVLRYGCMPAFQFKWADPIPPTP